MKQRVQEIGGSQEVKFSLKERFEQISSQPVTREVKLRYQSCCGCGCSDMEVMRTVPFDSPLQNGDRIEDLGPNDEIL